MYQLDKRFTELKAPFMFLMCRGIPWGWTYKSILKWLIQLSITDD